MWTIFLSQWHFSSAVNFYCYFSLFLLYVTGQYIRTYLPPSGGGGGGGVIEKKITQLGKGKNNLASILPYFMTFVVEFQGYFMIFTPKFVLTEHF